MSTDRAPGLGRILGIAGAMSAAAMLLTVLLAVALTPFADEAGLRTFLGCAIALLLVLSFGGGVWIAQAAKGSSAGRSGMWVGLTFGGVCILGARLVVLLRSEVSAAGILKLDAAADLVSVLLLGCIGWAGGWVGGWLRSPKAVRAPAATAEGPAAVRRFGPYAGAAVWYAAGFLSFFAFLVGVYALVVLGVNVYFTLPMGVFLTLAGFLFARAKRHVVSGADEALRGHHQGLVLVLRSFRFDGARVQRYSLLLLLGRWNPIQQWGTLEELLTRQFRKLGPVIAIGRPEDTLPPLGAHRKYLAQGEEWRAQVERYLQESLLVLVVVGRTEGLAWEARHLVERISPTRVIFVLPPLKDPALQLVWSEFRLLMQDIDQLRLPADLPSNAIYIRFSEDWIGTAVAVPRHWRPGFPRCEDDYQRALKGIEVSRRLATMPA
jgi:hypothetical protein